MRWHVSIQILFWLLSVGLSPPVECQILERPGGSISGRLLIETNPAPGIRLLLCQQGSMRKALAKTVTDADGRYSLTHLAGGNYRITVLAPGYFIPGVSSTGRTSLITLREGEALAGLDFTLERGGVITGRVSDSEGHPLIREEVLLCKAGQRFPVALSTGWSYLTDDRGVYRLYGVPPGRYTVSIGEYRDNNGFALGGGDSSRPRTFYPGVTEEAQAVIVEVHAGEEIGGIDIAAAGPAKTYSAAGRVISEETGTGVPNLVCEAMFVSPEGIPIDSAGTAPTDADGGFTLRQLRPGRYAVKARSAPNGENVYSEPVYFQIAQGDVSGLELRLRRGASIAGTVVIEGQDLGSLAERFSAWNIATMTDEPASGGMSKIETDGSFLIRGLSPGRFGLSVWARTPGQTVPPRILRIEHRGQVRDEGIELGAGEHLTGVRVVLAEGTAGLQGQVRVIGGSPERIRFGLLIARNLRGGPGLKIAVDARGQFFAANLPAGTYELQLNAALALPPSQSPVRRLSEVKQVVTLTENGHADVVITLDLTTELGQTP